MGKRDLQCCEWTKADEKDFTTWAKWFLVSVLSAVVCLLIASPETSWHSFGTSYERIHPFLKFCAKFCVQYVATYVLVQKLFGLVSHIKPYIKYWILWYVYVICCSFVFGSLMWQFETFYDIQKLKDTVNKHTDVTALHTDPTPFSKRNIVSQILFVVLTPVYLAFLFGKHLVPGSLSILLTLFNYLGVILGDTIEGCLSIFWGVWSILIAPFKYLGSILADIKEGVQSMCYNIYTYLWSILIAPFKYLGSILADIKEGVQSMWYDIYIYLGSVLADIKEDVHSMFHL